nr:hypothetical protein [Tanacetum cinerariifolium]
MLNKDNYVPWLSRIIRYARSRPNGKMIVDSIENGPYVRPVIATPGEPDLPVSVPKTFHEQTDEELTENDIKQMDGDNQAIQTILLGFLKMSHSQNSYNFLATHNDQSSSNTHSQQSFPIKNKYNPQPSFNQNFMQPPMTSLEDIIDPTEAMNATLILFAKAFRLTTLTNNNQRTSSNPRNRQIAQPGMNMSQDRQIHNIGGNGGNQFGRYAGQVAQNQQGLIVIPGIANQNETGNIVAARSEGTGNRNQVRCYNCRGLGHIARNYTVRPRRRDDAYLQTQLLIAQKEEAGIQLQAEEFDFMATAGDLDEIKEVNANCILMANLQQASTSGTQLDKAPVYDTDGSAEYGAKWGTIETISDPNEETHAHQETVYRNLINQVAQVNMVNCIMRATNAELKSELARYKIQEQRIEIKKKKLKHDFKTREDKYLDKEVDLEAKIKELENILLKRDQTVQTMHMLNPNPDSFYHPNQKMALGYPNPLYLKQAQLKQQSLYNGNLLLEKHDPLTVYDSEETFELAQESREKMRFLKKEIKPANCAKINHLSGVFVPQTTKSMEKLFLSYVSNTVTVPKTISIPNEDLSNDTTPSVARKFLNEVKNSFVTLQRVVKQKMTLEVHNWSSFAHKEAQLGDLKGKSSITLRTSVTPRVDKPKLIDVTPCPKKLHASILSRSVPQPREFNVVKHSNTFTSGTQHDRAPVYNTYGSAKVHLNDNCYDKEIFNMFTQGEKYTDLLNPIPEPQLVLQNDNHVIFVAPSMVQSGGTVETSSTPNEEICAHQETIYCNLVDQVSQVDMVNHDIRATNAELKSKLIGARS